MGNNVSLKSVFLTSKSLIEKQSIFDNVKNINFAKDLYNINDSI